MHGFFTWLRARLSPRAVPLPPSQSTSGGQSPAVSNADNVAIRYYHVQAPTSPDGTSFDSDTRHIPRQLPDPPPGGRLLGRDPLVRDLCNRLKRGEPTAIVGPAGFGKSALAGEAIREVIGGDDISLQASPFSDGVVLLDIYRAKGRAAEIWNALANALIGRSHAELSARQRAELACRGRRILIIVEGAEAADGRDERCELKELLCVCDAVNRHMILTRDSTQAHPAQTVRMTEELDAAAAGELFDRIAGGSIELEIREAILARLQGHPLALTWAASLLDRGDESPQQLLREWNRSALPGLSDPIEARHTLNWLFDRSVEGLSTLERTALEAMGLLAHAQFPLEAVVAALGTETEARAALKRLVQSSLLRRSTQRDDHWRFTHILAYQFARREVGATPEVRARLASWLESTLAQLLEREDYLTLPGALLHADALLLTDQHQSLRDLANLTAAAHAYLDGKHVVTYRHPATSGLAVPESSALVVSIKERVRRSRGRMVAVAATLVLMAIGVLFLPWVEGTTYNTQAGEWRRIRLEDGSVVFLSELSEIRVSFSRAQRTIHLLRGHALFDVARDARRPLTVRSDIAEIQSLGTRFDVDHRNGPTRVTVVDGAVRLNTKAVLPWSWLRDMTLSLTHQDSQAHSLLLTKEQGAEIAGQAITPSDPTQVENAVAAWRDELVFDHQRLSVVAARINLETRRQLWIADSAAGDKRISGRYKTDHPEGLVLAIRDLYPDLTVRETEDGWVVQERTIGDGAR